MIPPRAPGVPGPEEADGTLEHPGCLACGALEAHAVLSSKVQLAPATGESFEFVRCERCGLVRLSPRPTPRAMGRYYPPGYLPFRGPAAWGRWAPLVRMGERGLDRRRVRAVLRNGALERETPVLDVGCGRPSFLASLQARTGAACVGTDTSAAGWSDGDPNWSGLTLVEGSLPEAEDALRALHPEGYTVLTLWHALEHAHDPVGLLRSLGRLAAPGARLLVEVPNLESIPARWSGPEWAGLHTPRHTAVYTPATLTHTLSAAGWEVESVAPHGTLDPFTLLWLGRQVRENRPLDGSLEGAFLPFLVGKVALLPLTLLQRFLSLGVQLARAWWPGPRTPSAPR